MGPVEVGRYGKGTAGWVGWVSTPKWVAFEATDGRVVLYRCGKDGAVVGDPVTI